MKDNFKKKEINMIKVCTYSTKEYSRSAEKYNIEAKQ